MKYRLTQPKIILLVGMMGVGKTSLGRLLSKKLGLPFTDSDQEIERTTGFTISELFAKYGEESFCKGEEKIMERLLCGNPCVLSSGGGAFLSEKTRLNASKNAVSIWLKAGSDVISKRTQGRTHRPLVPSHDNKKTIERLVSIRYPIYEKADITVLSYNEPPYKTMARVIRELKKRELICEIPNRIKPKNKKTIQKDNL